MLLVDSVETLYAAHHEHVDRGDATGLIAQEGPPGRRRSTGSADHVLGYSRLADLNAEFEQFTVDPRRTPQRVGAAHLTDQLTNFAID